MTACVRQEKHALEKQVFYQAKLSNLVQIPANQRGYFAIWQGEKIKKGKRVTSFNPKIIGNELELNFHHENSGDSYMLKVSGAQLYYKYENHSDVLSIKDDSIKQVRKFVFLNKISYKAGDTLSGIFYIKEQIWNNSVAKSREAFGSFLGVVSEEMSNN